MRRRTILFLAMFSLLGCAGATTVSVPWPYSVLILAPAKNLPPEIAAFSGTWEGLWGGGLPSRLAVELISPETATVVYAWADHPEGRFKGGWRRYNARVYPEGKLEFGRGTVTLTFTINKDFKSINGVRESRGQFSYVTMKRKGQ